MNPNDLGNLQGIPPEEHYQMTEMWKQFGEGNPSPAEILDFADQIDDIFSDVLVPIQP